MSFLKWVKILLLLIKYKFFFKTVTEFLAFSFPQVKCYHIGKCYHYGSTDVKNEVSAFIKKRGESVEHSITGLQQGKIPNLNVLPQKLF